METNDAAKRMSDAVSLAALNGGIGKWMSFRLSDGFTSNDLYDSRPAAVSHCLWPELYCFLQVTPGGMQPREADGYLSYFRQLYDAGGRFMDSEFQMPLMPLTRRDQERQVKLLVKGKN